MCYEFLALNAADSHRRRLLILGKPGGGHQRCELSNDFSALRPRITSLVTSINQSTYPSIVPFIHPSIHSCIYWQNVSITQITIQLTMLNGAPNRRGRLSLKTWLLHSNTPKQWCKYSLVLQQIKQSTINYIHTRIYNIVICASLRHRSKRASLPRIQNT